MNKLVIGIFFLLGVISNSFSQKSLSDYSYVIVSEQFEFQKEKDKYQLNSLTKFLFNKYGFHAYFDREVPPNVIRCDGLWAEAEGNSGLVVTRIQLVLRDCYGTEIYRTDFGISKTKGYEKAYNESIRNAFDELIRLNVNQKDTSKLENEKVSVTKEKLPVIETTVVAVSVNSDNKEPVITKVEKPIINLPNDKYTNYTNMGKTYLLRKTSSGYKLYRELLDTDDDLLLIGRIIIEDSFIYFESDKKEKSLVSFDKSNNLIIGEGKEKIIYNY